MFTIIAVLFLVACVSATLGFVIGGSLNMNGYLGDIDDLEAENDALKIENEELKRRSRHG